MEALLGHRRNPVDQILKLMASIKCKTPEVHRQATQDLLSEILSLHPTI